MGCASSSSTLGGTRSTFGSEGGQHSHGAQNRDGEGAAAGGGALQRVGQPIAPCTPFKLGGSNLTHTELRRMRNEFWNSRLDGNPYVWQAIRCACEALNEGDLGLCNSIMDASDLVCPSGRLTLCYDPHGRAYELPPFMCGEPLDMVPTLEEARRLSGSDMHHVMPPGAEINLKVQIAPREKRFQVAARGNFTVGDLKEAIAKVVEECEDADKPEGVTAANQRIIYCGRELSREETLISAGIAESVVIQVYVRRPQTLR